MRDPGRAGIDKQGEHHTDTRMGATRQFRSAGPMLLPNCTEAELCQLRRVVSANPKVKFLAFYHAPQARRNGVLVLAQAHEKLSLSKWRESIHPRLQCITPVQCMRTALEDARGQEGFEEFGLFSKKKPNGNDQPKPEEEPVGLREIMLRARKSFLQTLTAFFLPPDEPMASTGLPINTREWT